MTAAISSVPASAHEVTAHKAHARELIPSPVTADTDSIWNAQERLQSKALSLIGIRYRYGGSTPQSGFDCSGFVRYVLRGATGLNVGRTTSILVKEGRTIDRDRLQVGDLVFFNTLGRRSSHVGIYIGNGQFVHAPSTGSSVRVENMQAKYWRTRYTVARRLGMFYRNDISGKAAHASDMPSRLSDDHAPQTVLADRETPVLPERRALGYPQDQSGQN